MDLSRQRSIALAVRASLALTTAFSVLGMAAQAAAQIYFSPYGYTVHRPIDEFEPNITPGRIAAILARQGYRLAGPVGRRGEKIVAFGVDDGGYRMRFVIDPYEGEILSSRPLGPAFAPDGPREGLASMGPYGPGGAIDPDEYGPRPRGPREPFDPDEYGAPTDAPRERHGLARRSVSRGVDVVRPPSHVRASMHHAKTAAHAPAEPARRSTPRLAPSQAMKPHAPASTRTTPPAPPAKAAIAPVTPKSITTPPPANAPARASGHESSSPPATPSGPSNEAGTKSNVGR
jgi:hypothetical protein